VVIDFHTHLLPPHFQNKKHNLTKLDLTFAEMFSNKNSKIANLEDLILSMDSNGIEISVVVNYGWTELSVAQTSNDYLLEASSKYPDRIRSFISINPLWGDDAIREIERCVSSGASGIGELHPSSQSVELPDEPGLNHVMQYAEALRIPVMFHSSEPVGHGYPGKGTTTPAKLFSLIKKWNQVEIICSHWGGGLPFYGHMPEVKTALSNVYFDSAASPFLYDKYVYQTVANSVGSKHMLFGSDFPLLSPKLLLDQISETCNSELSADLLHNNASRILGLEPLS
tara:strand:- start:1051 stop:1899 length:849 start_codon:yes stop_codon:yes gene_type:complete